MADYGNEGGGGPVSKVKGKINGLRGGGGGDNEGPVAKVKGKINNIRGGGNKGYDDDQGYRQPKEKTGMMGKMKGMMSKLDITA